MLEGFTETAIEELTAQVAKGHSLSKSGKLTGFLTQWEIALIEVGEASGELESVLMKIADYYEHRHLAASRLQSRLTFPVAVLVMALILAPLPALVQGAVSLGSYVLTLMLQLSILFICLSKLLRQFTQASHTFRGGWWLKRALKDGQDGLFRKLFERDYLQLFAMLADAGVDHRATLGILRPMFDNPMLSKSGRAAMAAIDKGRSLHEALATNRIIQRPDNLAVISSGEASGTLAASLKHQAELCSVEIDNTVDNYLSWAPKIFYCLVAIFIISNIF